MTLFSQDLGNFRSQNSKFVDMQPQILRFLGGSAYLEGECQILRFLGGSAYLEGRAREVDFGTLLDPSFGYLPGTETSFLRYSTIRPRFCDFFNSVFYSFWAVFKNRSKTAHPFFARFARRTPRTLKRRDRPCFLTLLALMLFLKRFCVIFYSFLTFLSVFNNPPADPHTDIAHCAPCCI